MSRQRPNARSAAATLPLGRPAAERSLDPTDWRAYRELAHVALDKALDFIEEARERPVWQPIPERVKIKLQSPLPLVPSSARDIVGDIEQLVMPYTCGNWHPRFFGWVHGTGTAGGVIAEMLAAAMNANVGGRDHSAVYVERQVIDWCRQIFSFPETSGGLLVSGTSMATLIALTVARNNAAATLTDSAAVDVRRSGLRAIAPRLVAYTSKEAHGSVAKAMELLGLGRDSLRAVPAGADFRLDVVALKSMIAADRASGHCPFAVVATAGTVNTGAIDDLDAIAGICADAGLWMHVDGAFGSLAVLSETMKPRLRGIERAHSIAFDFHKWLHVPYDAGCVLVRDGALQLEAFSQRPAYLAREEKGLAAGDPWSCEMGPELSRGFRALKVWFTLREHGLDALGRQIERNCALARYLESRAAATPGLEMLAPVSLNIACLRATSPGLDAAALDRLNADIVIALQEKGIAAPSTTRIGGKLAIRVNITNHRTRREDIDILLDAVREEAADRLQILAGHALAAQPAAVEIAQGEARAETEHGLGEARARLARLLGAPALAPVADEVAVSVSPDLSPAFAVEAGRLVLGPGALACDESGAVLLRHGLEAAHWLKFKSGELTPEWSAAIAVMAAVAGARHLALLPKDERAAALHALPPAFRGIYERAGAGDGGVRLLMQPGTLMLATLIAMQPESAAHAGAILSSTSVRVEASNILIASGELYLPSEALLVSGGDARVTPCPESGRNGYSASPRPEPSDIAFSSSTASSISLAAFGAVEALRQKLIAKSAAGDLATAFTREMASLRGRIATLTGAREVDGAEIVLTASGTETELAALHFVHCATGRSTKPLLSIVIDANETGSGVPLAAAGRYFLRETSLGAVVEAGAPVPGFAPGAVEVVNVGLRAADGSLRPESEIAGEVVRLVATAHWQGRRVLLHVLDASKTGAGAPDLATVLSLMTRYPGTLDVIVDACQMRLQPTAVKAYLEHGCMVQITGSKFFTGPPFSGALLLPPSIARRRPRQVPEGLLDYAGQSEWPRPLARAHGLKPRRRNLGLLMRWTAALAEIDAFRRIPAETSLALLRRFSGAVQALIGEQPHMALIPTRPFDRSALGIEDNWSDLVTIVPFALFTGEADRRRPLDMSEMKRVHRLLAEDLSLRLPDADRMLAGTRCILGQPVRLSDEPGSIPAVLRLCASSRLVSEALARQGPARRAREELANEALDTLLAKARLALAKAALVAANLHRLP